jgi:hypothetical protein
VSVTGDAWVAVATGRPDYPEVWQDEKRLARLVGDLLDGPQNGAETEVLAALFETGLIRVNHQNPELKDALEKLRTLRDAIERPVFVRTLTEGTSAPEPVYIRGNHKRPSEEKNPRHFLEGLGGEAMTGRGSGRLEWVEHLLSPDNPLTARVRVNRIWSRVFGRGIVASVNDFGKMGEAPSHPELLDHLAGDFVKEDWSIKKMVRKMVLSSTFRMSSVPSDEAASMDPSNSLLQHMPIRRMSAESVRDHILAASGALKRNLTARNLLLAERSRKPEIGGTHGGEREKGG